MAILTLDAMGVIYHSADDVAELLIPFIFHNGGITDTSLIKDYYTLTSLGKMPVVRFWEKVGIDPSLEDSYLSGHKLFEDFLNFISRAQNRFEAIYCISNDVNEWSKKLREIFCLENLFDGFIISGEVGSRKPSKEIFQYFLDITKSNPFDVTFVDDRSVNLDTAEKLGFQTILFGPDNSENIDKFRTHKQSENFSALSQMLLKPE